MNFRKAAAVLLVGFAALGMGLNCDLFARPVPESAFGKSVYLIGQVSDASLLRFLSSAYDAPVLLDGPVLAQANARFLKAYTPDRVICVGDFSDTVESRQERLLVPAVTELKGEELPGRPATSLVVCPSEPRDALLQAACLAGSLNAELYVLAQPDEDLKSRFGGRDLTRIYAVGTAAAPCRQVWPRRVTALATADDVATAHRKALRKTGMIHNLVVANPSDIAQEKGKMSTLAPWVALQRHAGLILTDSKGTNVAAAVDEAVRRPELAHADTLILVADLHAIPMEKRPNPAPGKDTEITMEPLTPRGTEPFSYAIGRLFHDEPGVVPLMLARERLLPEGPTPRKVLLVSNPGGGLSLLESISHNTVNEFENRGYDTTFLFNDGVTADKVRELLPKQDIFVWEGHYRTLVDRFGMPKWTEPLPPSLIFLQSCLALNQAEAQPLFERGALALVGSPTRTYSGSGGAFTLSFFDAVLYEQRNLGMALRQGKNFLMAYALLKEKRLGKNAKLAGANRRAAWAFTLWGDPTVRLPQPEVPDEALERVKLHVYSETLTVTLPAEKYDQVHSGRYETELWPNARLAGLVTRNPNSTVRKLVPMLFAEVHLPKGAPGKIPHLTSKLPDQNWVFSWDARRKVGYLLALPRSRDRELIRFHVEWKDGEEQEKGPRRVAQQPAAN